MSLLLRGARLADGNLVDVRIAGASIAEVTPTAGRRIGASDSPEADLQVVDLEGALLLPALTEPHAHLDKAFLAELIPNPTGDLIGAIEAMHSHRHLITSEDTRERAARAIDLLVANGTTAIRTHADVTVGNGLMSVEALTAVASERATVADIQIVALVGTPVVGEAGRENRALLRAALAAGAGLVGGCPHLEDDVAESTRILLEIAAEAGVGVDLHTDETLDPSKLGLLDLAERVLATGFPHPVTASHCVSLGMVDAERQRHVAERVAAAGISVVANPDTNLYLQGRHHATGTPRGLTAIAALREAGVPVAAGGDNLQDPFNPLGRGDPLDTAVLMVLAGHLLPDDAFGSIADAGRRAMALDAVEVAAGSPAELVALDVRSIREALAFTPPRRLVVHQGRIVHRA
jgi:cytosine/creatinine deaminase